MIPKRPTSSNSRFQLDRVSRVAAQDTWVMGRVLVEGVGEVTVDVPFPVSFGERPLPILGGGELEISDSTEKHNYPTATAVVVDWHMDSTGVYYEGAKLAVTTAGRLGQRIYVTFAFVGMALSNRAQGADESGEV